MAKKTTSLVKSFEVDLLDRETGEIISSTQEVSKMTIEKEPPFVKLYIDDIVLLSGLPEGVSNVLYDIVSNMSYNNMFIAHKTLKEVSCKKLGMSLNTYNQYISKLKSSGILIEMSGRGLYIVNPKLFAKGEWKTIKEIRLVIDYNNSPDKSKGLKRLSSNVAEQIRQLTLFPNQNED